MITLISGVDVGVSSPVNGEPDRLGNPTVIYGTPVTVENVLVAPSTTNDMEAARPEGVTVAYTLHFPKTFTESLEGCLVTLPAPWGGTYRVVGDPMPYIDVDTPTPWDRQVDVEAAHG